MISKTFPAFGRFIIRNEIEAGEILEDDIFRDGIFTADDSFAFVWVYSKGLIRNVNVDTGVEMDRPAGYNNLDQPEPVGTWRAHVVEPTVVFCMPPVWVNAVSPPLIKQLRYFYLAAGQSIMLEHGTKLSLCDGKLRVGDKVIPSMRQVQVSNGDREALAIDDCYGILFP